MPKWGPSLKQTRFLVLIDQLILKATKMHHRSVHELKNLTLLFLNGFLNIWVEYLK